MPAVVMTTMRALVPSRAERLRLRGYEIFFETFGDPAAPAVLLLPAWQITHSRIWKMQVPFLARSFHVVTYDSPGNGGAERTEDQHAFEYDRVVDQGVDLLTHLGITAAGVLGFSRGCGYGLWMAARYPDRVRRLVLIGNTITLETFTQPPGPAFFERRERYEGWDKRNYHFWLEHYDEWTDFFFTEFFTEPHSTKPFDDAIVWAHQTTPQILVKTIFNAANWPRMSAAEAIAAVRCPVLIIHGSDDRPAPLENSRKLVSARPDFTLLVIKGSGHGPHLRDAIRVNLVVSDFLSRPVPASAS